MFFFASSPDLPSEGTLGNFVAVLSRNAELGIQFGPGEVQVDGWSATHHLYKKEKIYRKHKFTEYNLKIQTRAAEYDNLTAVEWPKISNYMAYRQTLLSLPYLLLHAAHQLAKRK